MKAKLLIFAMMLVLVVNVWAQTPAPYDLTAVQVGDDSVQLDWMEPVIPFDGFEDFESGVIPPDSSIYNVNNDNTWGILDQGYNSSYSAACLYDNPVNDDWLVSPELAITSTSELSFMAGNYIASYAEEEFEVYISTVGPDPASFPATPELYYQFLADSVYWEPFNIDLSSYAGQTVWLGIRCISPYMWYLLIDDFSVTNLADGSDLVLNFDSEETQTILHHASLEGEPKDIFESRTSKLRKSAVPVNRNRDLLGYNVYRDTGQINPDLVTDLTYLDEGLSPGTYEYYVTAVYDEGESDPSDIVSIELLPVGTCDEGFESGDFLQFPWILGGDLPWLISTDQPFYGTYCAKSGAIVDNQESVLSITLNITTAGELSFAHRVSSEESWDFLEFYIDDLLQDQWSGITDWSFPSSNVYPIDVGTHTFKWRYMKDPYASGGEDCAWIDHISFPDYADPGILEGTVTNVTGDLIADALVSLNQGLIETYTDANGFYQFPALSAGLYDVSVSKDGYADFTGSVDVISAQTIVYDVTLTPLTSVSVTGIVQNEAGNSIDNAEVTLTGDQVYNTTTNASGEFTFAAVTSNQICNILIQADGFVSYTDEVNVLASNVDLGTIVLTELIYPVSEVEAVLNNSDQAEISWAEPGVNISDEFRHDDGVYHNVMSFSPTQFPNHMFGSAFKYKGLVDELRWWLSDGNSSGHPEVQLLVLGLKEDGSPDSDNLILDTGWIPNTDNEWNTYTLPEQIDAPEGFFVGLRVNSGGGTYIVFDDGWEEEYPGSFPHTTTYEGEYGNSWGNNNTNNNDSWFDFDYEGRSCNVMIRATGLIIEELVFDGESSITTGIEDSGVSIGEEKEPHICSIDSHTNQISFENREVENYDVWRVEAGDEQNPDEWIQIENGITTTSCIDEEVGTLPTGLYRYAVKANYTGGYASNPKFSYFIVWNMFAEVTVNVNTGNNDPTTGAYVRLIGEDGLAALYDENYKEHIIEINNSVSFDVWKQEWSLYVDLAGYEQYVQENVFIFNNTTIDVVLTDSPVPAINVEAEYNTSNNEFVDVSWDPALEEILWDQFSNEGSSASITLQDFVDPGWHPFDREGAFDFVLNEPALITKLFFRVTTGLSYSSPTFPPQYYYDPIPFHVAVFEDFNNAPRENWVDSLDTNAVAPNNFWEYEITIDPPFDLDAGTWWIGTSSIFDIHAMDPNYSSTTRFNRRPSMGNGTEMYYRLPRDGYNQGWDTWQSLSQVVSPGTQYPELCARVIGRTQSTTRSVTGYNIYRLHPGEENNPAVWIELETNYSDLIFTDETIPFGTDDFRYAIEAVFPNGLLAEVAFSNELEVTVDTQENTIPLITVLQGNYPNPFNPETTIKFSLNSTQNVNLKIYNMKGQVVKTLVNGEMEAETHEIVWNGVDDNNKNVASGIYFYEMKTEDYSSVKKMIMLK